MIDDRLSTKPRNISFKAYKKLKLRMLDDFCVKLTKEQRMRFDSLKTEIEVDNFCLSRIDELLK